MVRPSQDELVRPPNYGVEGGIPEQLRLPDWVRYRKIDPPSNPANPFGDLPKLGPQRTPPLDLRNWPMPTPLNPPTSPTLPNWPGAPMREFPGRDKPSPPTDQLFYERLPNTPTLSPQRADLVNWLLAILDKRGGSSESNPDNIPARRWNGITPGVTTRRNSSWDPRSPDLVSEPLSEFHLPSSPAAGLFADDNADPQRRSNSQSRWRGARDQPVDEWTVPPPIFFPFY
jgi:hypothetical protein